MDGGRLRDGAARVLVVALLAGGSIVASTPSWGAGTSASTNGCYAQWWNTAWTSRCTGTTASGNFRVKVARQAQADLTTAWTFLGKGSRIDPLAKGEALYKVQSARVDYTG